MNELQKAIIRRCEQDSELKSAVGRPFLYVADRKAKLPYLVMGETIELAGETDTEGNEQIPATVDLSVYASSHAQASALGRLVRAKFHFQTLPLGDGEGVVVRFARQASRVWLDQEPDEQGNPVYRAMNEFDVLHEIAE